jgi:hypothetical protein
MTTKITPIAGKPVETGKLVNMLRTNSEEKP